ncbi:MAG: hypothetical protein WAN75_44415, partial [Xanthobacteraceae bacterium]
RQIAGGTPKARLNARLKAASESYPTCPAMLASGMSQLMGGHLDAPAREIAHGRLADQARETVGER